MPLAASEFVVTPGLGMVIWAVLAILCLVGGGITIAKARWDLLLAGVLTGGLALALAPFVAPRAGSAWSR